MTRRRPTPRRAIRALPQPVEETAPVWIPMPDGARLAGRLWRPAWASAERPVPALLELIPYRTRDLTALRDEGIHAAFAANGYASLRVDIRGSGNSEGLIPDEYLAQTAGRRRPDRLARGPALVHGARGHVRQQLGRLQRAPGRGASAARPWRHRVVLLHRRPVRGRHALAGRRAAHGHARLGRHVPVLDGAAARPRGERRPPGASARLERIALAADAPAVGRVAGRTRSATPTGATGR
ncbi:MAG: CocE/NonD family hydrolase [Tetrasphaera sp.]